MILCYRSIMPTVPAPRFASSWWEFLLPLIVGTAMFGITLLGWQYSLKITSDASRLSFENHTDLLADTVRKRFHLYENILYDARGFYSASDQVTREDWATYIANVEIGKRDMGLTSLQILNRVSDTEKTNFIKKIRAEGSTSKSALLQSFTIFPETTQSEYFPVTYIEPQSSNSAKVLGFDHASNPIRKAALEMARDTGQPQISGITQAVVNDQDVLIMYIPLYADKATPPDEASRQTDLIGYISGGFSIQTIFPQIITDATDNPDFTMRFYDGPQVDPNHLLYEQVVDFPVETQLQKRTQLIAVAGHVWTLESEAPQGYGLSANDRQAPQGTLFVGSIITVLLMICTYLLVSSRKQAVNLAQKIARDLEVSDTKYRQMFESLQDVLYRTDLKGIITTISPSIQKYTGLTPEQLIGRNALEFYFDVQQRQAMLQQLLQNGSVQDYQIKLKNRENQSVEVSLNAHVLVDENNQPIGVEGVLRDITARVQAEQLLRQQAEALAIAKRRAEEGQAKDEAILSSIGDGVVVTDNSGRVMFANRVVEQLLGWSTTEIIGKFWVEDLPKTIDQKGNAIPKENRALYKALQSGMKTTLNYIYLRKDNSKLPVSVTASPVILNQSIIGGIVVFRDITKEHEVDRMKTEFISLASHQLRTPLTAMKWFLEMLLAGDAGPLNKEQTEFMTNINTSNERMIELVNGLLNISRIESGRLIIEPSSTDLNRLIEEVLVELKPRISAKQQQLSFLPLADLPQLNLDQKLIRQVYSNLLTNAMKYTPAGGHISIILSKTATEVITQISDTGLGIPKAEQSHIFEKFYRGSNVLSIKDATNGTGLGLYLIKAILESSGGKLWFESEQGKGTSFFFSLPLAGMMEQKGEVSLD